MASKYELEKERILRGKIECMRQIALTLIKKAVLSTPSELRRGISMPVDVQGFRFYENVYYVFDRDRALLAALMYVGKNETTKLHEFSLLPEGSAEFTGIMGSGQNDLSTLVISDVTGRALVQLDGKGAKGKYSLPKFKLERPIGKCQSHQEKL